MRTQNNKYWKDRAEKRMDFAMLKAEEISKKIGRAYVRALQDMREQIDNIYRNFSAGLSQAEAKRLLRNIKSDSILKKLKKAVDKIEDEKLKAKVIAQLNAPAYKARMERLKRLAENAKQVCENIAGQSVTLMDKGFADIVKNTYYRSIFDTRQGTGLAFGFSGISENAVKEILRTNWSGKHYSSRIWDNTDKLASVLEDELLTGVLTGRSSGRMANSIQDIMHSSYSRTLTLVRTEASFVSNQAELESYSEMGIDKYRYAATLDMRTSKICQSLDGKEFPVAEARAGENYPPMHPRCRSTTVSVIDGVCYDKLERSARDPETGKIIKVPQNMTYGEWYEKYVDKSEKSGIIKIGEVKDVALENQRYGRNKDTLVNKAYIEGGEYRRKFDNATNNADVNKTLYVCAKKALKHRSGTVYEDMYWIDGNTGKIILSVTDSTDERAIVYTDKIRSVLKNNDNIVTVHTHPSSMPPSASDLNSNFTNGYTKGFVACHNGKVFGYTSNELFSEKLNGMYIQRFINQGYDEFEAQIKAMEKLSETFDIKVWEVDCNG